MTEDRGRKRGVRCRVSGVSPATGRRT